MSTGWSEPSGTAKLCDPSQFLLKYSTRRHGRHPWHPLQVGPPRRRWRRTALLASIVVALVVILALFARSRWFEPWPELRDEVARFGVPDGMRLALKIERGSGACFISCDEPRIAVVFRDIHDAQAACDLVRRRLEQRELNLRQTPDYVAVPERAACFYEASLDRVGSEAVASVAVLPGEELQRFSWLTGGEPARAVTHDEIVAVVLFNSGID